jgi:hypothetical protein
MPRVSKKTELAPMEKPSMLPEDYADYNSALIQFGKILWQKNNKMLIDGGEGSKESLPLSLVQIQYLNMRMVGLSRTDACKALGISSASPMLWEEESGKTSLYCCCVDAIKRKQADELEDNMWDTAMNDSSSRRDIMKMFLIKPRKPEYKENSTMVNVPVQVNISVDREPYVVDSSIKVVEEDSADG